MPIPTTKILSRVLEAYERGGQKENIYYRWELEHI